MHVGRSASNCSRLTAPLDSSTRAVPGRQSQRRLTDDLQTSGVILSVRRSLSIAQSCSGGRLIPWACGGPRLFVRSAEWLKIDRSLPRRGRMELDDTDLSGLPGIRGMPEVQ